METRELRTVASIALLIVGCLALAGGIAAVWVDSVLLDTDTFVAALEPLARDEGVRDAAAERISSEIVDRADIRSRSAEIVPEFLEPLAERVADEFERFVRTGVRDVVYSEVFVDIWADGVRIWHGSFSEAITGRGDAYLDFEDGAMRIALEPYLAVIESRVENPVIGPVVTLALDPVRDTRITLVRSRLLVAQLEYLRWLYRVRVALWPLSMTALFAGVALATRRDIAAGAAGAGVALACGAPALWLVAQRISAQRVLGSLSGATPESSRAAYDALVAPLLGWYLVATGCGLAVVAGAWLYARLRASRQSV